MMIANLEFRFGSSPESQPLRFSPGPMTVFVGPNNSGKSLVLREIESLIRIGHLKGEQGGHFIINQIELDKVSREDILQFVAESYPSIYSLQIDERSDNIQLNFTPMDPIYAISETISYKAIYLETEGWYHKGLERGIAAAYLIRLDGSTRLNLTNAAPSGDLQNTGSSNLLMTLLSNDNARARVREVIFDAFHWYFVVDPIAMTQLRIKFSRIPPGNPDQELSLTVQAREFYGKARPIEEFSDGIRAFTGLTATVLSKNFRIVLIDEPEAFLYPPLARKLGKTFAQTGMSSNANIFISTHSPEFLMGCVQSGGPVNIVRLTYNQEIPSARILPGNELQTLMRDPLLRSTGVLNALFHQGAIVCEADRDRAFYEEINLRLVAKKQGVDDVLFLNVTNKQTLRKVIAPLRRMGIPIAAVVDLDVIKDQDLTALLRSAYVPSDLVDAWGMLKKRVLDAFTTQGIDMKTQGIDGLDKTIRESASNLIANIAAYGVFIVPVGEVERWLLNIGANIAKPNWLSTIFEGMGSDPADPSYVHPEMGDVWDFMRQIANWIADPARKGIPE